MRKLWRSQAWIGVLCVAGCSSAEHGDPRWYEPGDGGSGLTKGQPGAKNGDIDYCNDPAHRCVSGEGDCDAETHCFFGLVCGYDNGPQFGMGSGWDVCVPPTCRNFVQDANEASVDCGGTSSCGQCISCPIYPNAHASHCSSTCPCPTQEGDCDANEECASGLVCTPHVGARFGMHPDHDVCLPAHCSNAVQDADEAGVDVGGTCGGPIACPANGLPDTCSLGCPCPTGHGDCDSDSHCQAGLVCGRVLGEQFGIKAEFDVCVPAHCANGQVDAGDGELGLDCGGDCGSCMATPEPSTCSLAPSWETATSEWLVNEITSGADGRQYGAVSYFDGVSYRWRVARSVTQGTVWPYIDFWAGLGGGATAHDATTDAQGRVYVQGEADDAQTRRVVIRKLAGGAGWTTVDTFGAGPIPEPGNPSYAGGIVASQSVSGLVFSAVTTLGDHWLVRRTMDGGLSWQSVDELAHAGAQDITIAPNGDVYVVGMVSGQWLARRSTNGGSSWQTVDFSTFSPGSSIHGCQHGGVASAVGVTPSGSVFVAGSCFQGDSSVLPWTYWEVRRSSSGAVGSWSSVDTFVDPGGGVETAMASDLTTARDGSIHVIGTGSEQQWLVRSSTDAGTTWASSDAPDSAAEPAVPEKIAGGNGTLYATGTIGDVTVVRRRLCE